MPRFIRDKLRALSRSLQYLSFFVLFVIASVFTVLKAPAPIVNLLIEDDMRAQSVFWQQQVIQQLDDAGTSFATSQLTEHDEHFLQLLIEASETYNLHLFDETGHIFWSTEVARLNGAADAADVPDIVTKGETYYLLREVPVSEVRNSHAGHAHTLEEAGAHDDDDAHHADEPDAAPHTHEDSAPHTRAANEGGFDALYRNILPGHADESTRFVSEIYVPYMNNGRFGGAIQFHSDVTEMRETILARVRLSLGLIALAVTTTLVFAGSMLHRTNSRHLSQLNARNTKERDIMDKQLRLAREVQLLGELNEWLQSSHSLEELFEMVARFMTHILPSAEGSVYVYSNSRDVLDGCASWNGGTHRAHIHPEACWGLRRGRTYEYGASEVDFTCDHAEPHDGRPYYCFPILAHGETVGLLHLRAAHGAESAFRQSKKLARMCSEQISMAIANVRMRDQLHDQSVRDPLTGLFNRRHMTETLRKAIGTSQNTGAPLSLIAVDVDHFKKFNDNHGHDAGDMVLRAVGAALEKACDGDEVACRMGGEEFTLILPGTSNPDTLAKAEALRKSVEEITVRYGEKALPHITISLGVAHYPQHGTLPQDLMRASDEALYESKAKGRNQVQVAGQPSLDPRDAEAAQQCCASSDGPDIDPASAVQWQRDLQADLAKASQTDKEATKDSTDDAA